MGWRFPWGGGGLRRRGGGGWRIRGNVHSAAIPSNSLGRDSIAILNPKSCGCGYNRISGGCLRLGRKTRGIGQNPDQFRASGKSLRETRNLPAKRGFFGGIPAMTPEDEKTPHLQDKRFRYLGTPDSCGILPCVKNSPRTAVAATEGHRRRSTALGPSRVRTLANQPLRRPASPVRRLSDRRQGPKASLSVQRAPEDPNQRDKPLKA